MGYVDYSDTDDMQDDTYKIITGLILEAHIAFQTKNLPLYHSSIDGLYLLVWKRLPKELSVDFEMRLNKAAEMIYSIGNNQEEPEQLSLVMSQVFDTLRLMHKEILGTLDDAGILFKMRADSSKLVTRHGKI